MYNSEIKTISGSGLLGLRWQTILYYCAPKTKIFLEGLSVRSRDKQVMLRTTKIMPVDGINAGEFIRQVFRYKVIYSFKH